jgi:hypothetical protein
MITPRESFKNNPDYSKKWPDVVDSRMFGEAVNAAMLEMNLQNSNPPDMGSAAAFQWRAEGAKQFLRIFMGLSDGAAVKKAPLPQNLDHRI